MEHKPKEQAKAGNPKNNRMLAIISVVMLLILGAAGYYYWKTHYMGIVSTNDAYVNSHPITISSKILGRIKTLTVDEGSKIKKGQVLVMLDNSELLASKQQAIATLNQTVAKYNYSTKNVKLAEINYEKIKEDYNRYSHLVKEDVISIQTFAHEKKAFQSAAEEIQAQKARLKVAQSQISAAQKTIDFINTELANTILYSPVNGIIVKKWEMQGNIINPGTPIFTVYNLSHVWVTANVKETDFKNIKIGQKVEIYVDSYPDKKFTGKIFEIGSASAAVFSLIPPNNASGNFIKMTQRIPVRISIDNLSTIQKITPLLPDMSVAIKIETG